MHQLQPLLVDQVGLCQRDNASLYVQEIKNGQVFASLRHNALVGGNNQQRRINTAHTREHIFDEAFVTGDIDNADLAPTWQFEPGKAQVYRHAAFFFFRQAIGINACQSFDERRFPMVYMAGSTNTTHG